MNTSHRTITNNAQLTKQIMRRIYVALFWRVSLHPLTLLSVSAVAVTYVLSRLVFVSRIWAAFIATPVGQVPHTLASIVVHADWPTLVVSMLFAVIMLGILHQIRRIRFVRHYHAPVG